MAGNPHPVYRDGVNVAKSAARSYTLLRLATADELRAMDGSTFWYAYIQELGGDFVRSTTDTTSPDDNETVIVDANGARWIRLSLAFVVGQTIIAGGIDKGVFYNNNGTLGEYAVSGSGEVAMTDTPQVKAPRFYNDSNSSSVEVARFIGARSAPASFDNIYTTFLLNNSLGSLAEAARLYAQITDASSGSFTARMGVSTAISGSMATRFWFSGNDIHPNVDAVARIGVPGAGIAGLHFSSLGKIFFATNDWIAEHSSGALTVTTGDLRVATQGSNDKSVLIKETMQPYVDFIGDQYFNPLMFTGANIGAKINAAITAANTVGTGIVQCPSGVLEASGIVLKTGARLRGAGNFGTTIKAPNGLNGALIMSQNFGSLTGTGNHDPDTPRMFGVENMTIDGNLSNVTWSVGILVYGYKTEFSRLRILNCKGNGINSEWGQYGRVSMESTFRDIVIDTTGDHGFVFKGAHDSHFENIMIIDAGQTADNTYYGFYNAAQYGNGRVVNMHCWHRDTVTNRVAMQCQSEGNTEYLACHFEGGRGQIRHAGQNDRVIGSFIYAPFGSAGTSLVYMNANANQHIGNTYNNNTAQDVYAISFGSSAALNVIDGCYFGDFKDRSPFNFSSSGGMNKIDAIGYAASGGATTFGGTPHADDIIHYKQGGTVIKYYREHTDYVQAANDSAAASAGVPVGGTYIDTSNVYALRIRIS